MRAKQAREKVSTMQGNLAQQNQDRSTALARIATLEAERRPLVTAVYIDHSEKAAEKLGQVDAELSTVRQRAQDLEAVAAEVERRIEVAMAELAAAEWAERTDNFEELGESWNIEAVAFEKIVTDLLVPAIRTLQERSAPMARLGRELGSKADLRDPLFANAGEFVHYVLWHHFSRGQVAGLQFGDFQHKAGEDLASEFSTRGIFTIARVVERARSAADAARETTS